MELVEFLRQRLAEDEAAARGAELGPWHADGGVYATHPTDEIVDYAGDSAEHIGRHDPARVLAQVAAMRRILARLEYRLSMQPDEVTQPREWDDITRHLYEVAIDLASVWSSHPDYDPAWAPTAA